MPILSQPKLGQFSDVSETFYGYLFIVVATNLDESGGRIIFMSFYSVRLLCDIFS